MSKSRMPSTRRTGSDWSQPLDRSGFCSAWSIWLLSRTGSNFGVPPRPLRPTRHGHRPARSWRSVVSLYTLMALSLMGAQPGASRRAHRSKSIVVLLIAFCLVWPFYAFSETSRLPGLLGNIGVLLLQPSLSGSCGRFALGGSHDRARSRLDHDRDRDHPGWSPPLWMVALRRPQLHPPADPRRMAAWLEDNHMRGGGVWLINCRKAIGMPRMEYDEAVEEALCFDWVDSKPNKLDDDARCSGAAAQSRHGLVEAEQGARCQADRGRADGAGGLAKVRPPKPDGSWPRWMRSRRWSPRPISTRR